MEERATRICECLINGSDVNRDDRLLASYIVQASQRDLNASDFQDYLAKQDFSSLSSTDILTISNCFSKYKSRIVQQLSLIGFREREIIDVQWQRKNDGRIHVCFLVDHGDDICIACDENEFQELFFSLQQAEHAFTKLCS